MEENSACCCREHRATENDVCSRCEIHGDDAVDNYLSLKTLLKEAHDKMDDFNAHEYAKRFCFWCEEFSGYDANGLIHDDSCILVRIRRVLS